MKTMNHSNRKGFPAGCRLLMRGTLALFLMCFIPVLCAQRTVEARKALTTGQSVSLDFEFADKIDIRTWDEQEVLVKATVNINDNEDNDAFSLETGETSSGVSISSEIRDMDQLHRVVRKTITKKDSTTVTREYCTLEMDLLFEVFLPSSASLKIKTISGDIEFEQYRGELDVKTISGFIDLSLDPAEKADLEMSTISGEIYSNISLDFGKDAPEIPRIGGTRIRATSNGGGTRMELETISGDIFLRKAQ
jgi:DUF4097 and DUF4098 domain-containing protein YvlB